jgi:hypothetical protein
MRSLSVRCAVNSTKKCQQPTHKIKYENLYKDCEGERFSTATKLKRGLLTVILSRIRESGSVADTNQAKLEKKIYLI